MFKLKKRNFFAAILACLILCGCQKAPQSNTAENTFATGAIDNNGVHQTQTVPKEEKAIHREFTSTDGSVQFEMDIETDVAVSTLPVVKVQPHYLTVEDVQRVAYALFDNVDFYEREPYETATYSKAEIQNRLSNWSKYVSTEELRSLYGSEDNSFIQKLVRDYIQDYTLKMESASSFSFICIFNRLPSREADTQTISLYSFRIAFTIPGQSTFFFLIPGETSLVFKNSVRTSSVHLSFPSK